MPQSTPGGAGKPKWFNNSLNTKYPANSTANVDKSRQPGHARPKHSDKSTSISPFRATGGDVYMGYEKEPQPRQPK